MKRSSKQSTSSGGGDKTPQPMDPSFFEATVGKPATNAQRVCGALRTLVREAQALFPETPVEYSEYDGRNTALAASFDLTVLDDADRSLAEQTIRLAEDDPRIETVTYEEGVLIVAVRSSARTQDKPDSFGLMNGYAVLTDNEEGFFLGGSR